MDKVVITGVTGLLGRKLAARYLATHRVVGLSRGSAQIPNVDIQPYEQLEAAVRDAALVIHLAGESVSGRWSVKKKDAILTSRVEGTRALVKAIASLPSSHRPKKMMSASAVGYYGNRGDDSIDEQSLAGETFLSEVCVHWEKEARVVSDHGVDVTIGRIGLVLSRDGGALSAMLPTARLGLGGPLGSGEQFWPWIHETDVMRAIEHLASRRAIPTANLVSPKPVEQKFFGKSLGAVLNRPAVLPAPAFALRTALGEFSDALLHGQRVYPKALLESGFVFEFPELRAALKDLLE